MSLDAIISADYGTTAHQDALRAMSDALGTGRCRVSEQGREHSGPWSWSMAVEQGATTMGTARDRERDTVIVVDVRLDNRGHLESILGPFGGRPVSDAELLLTLYAEHGIDFVSRVRGDGSFVLWDGRLRRAVAWRDALGIRPLYYFHRKSPLPLLVVSADLRSLIAHPMVPPVLDLESAKTSLTSFDDFTHPERTLCAGVLKLRPAHVLVFDRDGVRTRRYWNPEDVPRRRHRDVSGYVEELRDVVDTAVRDRISGSSGAIGGHVSGGLDSSSTAVMAHRRLSETGRPFVGYSWAPPFDVIPAYEGDERKLVQAVTRQEHMDVRFSRLSVDDVLQLNRRDFALQPTTMLRYEIGAGREIAAQGVTTILSGWGGDEFVVSNGRGYFSDLARRGRLLRLRRELTLRAEIQGIPVAGAVRSRVIGPLMPDWMLYRAKPDQRWLRFELPPALRPDFADALRSVDQVEIPQFRERPGHRNMQIAKLRFGHLQYRMESWASYGSDIGVRYTYPLLDQRVVEFALGIPDHLYFRDGWKRWLYRTAMEHILPDSVRWYPHKQDTSMTKQRAKVAQASRDAERAQLLAQRDNPFVDVEQLLSEEPGPPAGRGPPPAPSKVASWLPFTKLGMQ